MAETTQTPPKALRAATIQNALPLRQLALLGTVETPGETRALVRLGTGRVEMVRPGDKVGGREVLAIERGALLISRAGAGAAQRLEVPGGDAAEAPGAA